MKNNSRQYSIRYVSNSLNISCTVDIQHFNTSSQQRECLIGPPPPPTPFSIVSRCFSIPRVDDPPQDDWTLISMLLRFPGSHDSQTGHICLRFQIWRVAIDNQEDARAGSGPITHVRASPRTSHRFGHLRSSSDISGHLGDKFHPQKYK